MQIGQGETCREPLGAGRDRVAAGSTVSGGRHTGHARRVGHRRRGREARSSAAGGRGKRYSHIAGKPPELVSVTCKGLAKYVPTSVDCCVGEGVISITGSGATLVSEKVAESPPALAVI